MLKFRSRNAYCAFFLGTMLAGAALILSLLAPAMAANTVGSSASTEFSIAAPPLTDNVSTNVKFFSDGSFSAGESTAVPHMYEGARKYSMVCSDTIKSDRPFKAATFNIVKSQKNSDDNNVMIEARACGDNGKWTEWLEANDNGKINFIGAYNSLQYRVTIIS